MNDIKAIAGRLKSLCSEFKFVEAYSELFADYAVSIDPFYEDKPLTGLENLIQREKQFLVFSEIHTTRISEPTIAGNYFTVNMLLDFTIKKKERKLIEELAVYKVDNGKIVSQQFFIGSLQ